MSELSNFSQSSEPSANSYEAPVTSTEKAIVSIFEELFQIDNVSASADLFELGADSLTAQQLVWRVRDQFGLDLSVMTIFDAPTPRELAAEIDLLLSQ
jgi:mycobactin peptide synthetase MbtE